jgi:ABC-type glycerol-3-phosphate transport system permease component
MTRGAARARLALEQGAVLGAVLVFLAPVLWLLTTGYKSASEVFSFPPRLGFTPTLANFQQIFAIFDVPLLTQNSLRISLGTTILSLLIGVPAGYALARLRTGWAGGIAYFFLAVRMVPPVATLIPFYLLARDAHVLGTALAVILLDTTLNTAFVVWMMFGNFRAISPEMESAALTDGCSHLGAFLRVALPLARPGLIVSALFCIMFAWNDFLFPAFLTSADSKPLSVALLSAYGTKDITWGTMGALAHFSTLPIVVMALALNRYFVQGLTRGMH